MNDMTDLQIAYNQLHREHELKLCELRRAHLEIADLKKLTNPPPLRLKYFVIKPGDIDAYGQASRDALLAYAESIKTTDRPLADSLFAWLNQITG